MKRQAKPATYAEARMAMAAAAVDAIMYRPTPAEERFAYLSEPDYSAPKIPFDTALYTITGVKDPKRALSSFRKFLVEELFTQQEVVYFVESRADRMPPIQRDKGWDFGGFLQSEVPTFKALFTKWRGAKRLENLDKGKKKSLTVLARRDFPETAPKRAEIRPKRSRKNQKATA